jgi:hypothetical protein
MTSFSTPKEQLDADVEAFLKAGGTIKKIPSHVSADDWRLSEQPLNRATRKKRSFRIRND